MRTAGGGGAPGDVARASLSGLLKERSQRHDHAVHANPVSGVLRGRRSRSPSRQAGQLGWADGAASAMEWGRVRCMGGRWGRWSSVCGFGAAVGPLGRAFLGPDIAGPDMRSHLVMLGHPARPTISDRSRNAHENVSGCSGRDDVGGAPRISGCSPPTQAIRLPLVVCTGDATFRLLPASAFGRTRRIRICATAGVISALTAKKCC